MKSKREWIAIYKAGKDDWRLITRELATQEHAEKLASKYEANDLQVRIIQLEFLAGLREGRESR